MRRWSVSACRWAVQLPAVPVWFYHRHAGSGWRGALHGMRGGQVQCQLDCGMCSVSGGFDDGWAGGGVGDALRRVCSWAVQRSVHHSMRCLCSGVHDRRCYMSCMRSWSVRQRNGFDGGMFCLCCRALPGQHGAHIVLRVRPRLGNKHSDRHGCCGLQGMQSRSVQRQLNGAVPGVSCRLRDQSARCGGRNGLHTMCSWHLHCSVDVSMPAVSCWVRDRCTGIRRCHQLHGVRSGTV